MSIADAFTPVIATATAQVDGDPVEIRENVLRVARAWESGDLPITGVRALFTAPELFVAMGHSLRNPDDRSLLIRLSEALIDNPATGGEMVYRTKHGVFTRSELAQAGARITPVRDDEGRIRARIQFPVPDASGTPIFLDTPEQRRAYANKGKG